MALVSLNVGRSRVNRTLSPSQAGYVRSVQAQMKQVKNNMLKVINGIENATVPGLKYATKPIFTTSQQLVPVKTGALKRSGYHEVRRTLRGVSVNIGYGRRGNPFYAPIVHERTELQHKAPTQSMYLREAVNRHVAQIPTRYVDYMQRRTGLRK